MSSKGTEKLVQKVGTAGLATSISVLGGYQQILTRFKDYIAAQGTPALLVQREKLDPAIVTAANKALTQLGTDFKSAQGIVGGLAVQVQGMSDVVSATGTFARHGKITTTKIMSAIIQYKKDKQSVDQEGLKSEIRRMISECDRFQNKVANANTNMQGAIDALNGSQVTLNNDLNALQQAVPPADGKVLDLDKLTESQAMAQLTSQLDGYQSDIKKLREEIAAETFGQVAVGLVGGAIAFANVWWVGGFVVAGVTAAGEILIQAKKKSDFEKLNTDMMNVSLTQAEQAILHPIYSIKNAISHLSGGVESAEQIKKSLIGLKNGLQAAHDDLTTFLDDVTANASLEDLQGDADYVQSDYDNLVKITDALILPLPSYQVTPAQLANPKALPAAA